MSVARNTMPRLVKQPAQTFDLSRSLKNLANGYRIIAIELEKMAAAGVTAQQLKELGIIKNV